MFVICLDFFLVKYLSNSIINLDVRDISNFTAGIVDLSNLLISTCFDAITVILCYYDKPKITIVCKYIHKKET